MGKKYFIIGLVLVLLSPIMGKLFTDMFYGNRLISSYTAVITNFTHAFMLAGALLFIRGFKEK